MNRNEFEEFKNEQVMLIADKAKEMEIALRVNQDWSTINDSRLILTKVKDRANEALAIYNDILEAEAEIEEETVRYNPYEEEDNSPMGYSDYDDATDFLGNFE